MSFMLFVRIASTFYKRIEALSFLRQGLQNRVGRFPALFYFEQILQSKVICHKF